MFKNSIILSGGSGIRMRPITDYIPKALVKVNNKPLIDYVINMLGDNIKKYITYNYKSDILFNNTNLKVDGFINTTKKDNSFFLYNSFVTYLNEPIIVVPCDMIMEINLLDVYNDYFTLGEPAIMIIGVEPNNNISGDFITHDIYNKIIKLDRDKPTNKYCSGLQIINPFKVNKITNTNDNFINVWDELIKLGELKVSNITPKNWSCYDDIKNII